MKFLASFDGEKRLVQDFPGGHVRGCAIAGNRKSRTFRTFFGAKGDLVGQLGPEHEHVVGLDGNSQVVAGVHAEHLRLPLEVSGHPGVRGPLSQVTDELLGHQKSSAARSDRN